MNAAHPPFAPETCWPIALKCLRVNAIPEDPLEGTALLCGFLITMKHHSLRNLAYDVAREITATDLDRNYDDCYRAILNYFLTLAAEGSKSPTP